MLELSPLKKQLHLIIQRTKADVEKRFAQAKIGITPLQYGVLLMVKHKPTTLNEIARALSFKAPSLVPVVDALEKAGLVERKADAADRRKNQLVITKKGLTLLKRMPAGDRGEALHRAFHKLSPVKQKQLLSLLQELIENFS